MILIAASGGAFLGAVGLVLAGALGCGDVGGDDAGGHCPAFGLPRPASCGGGAVLLALSALVTYGRWVLAPL